MGYDKPRQKKPNPTVLRRVEGTTEAYMLTDGNIKMEQCPCCLRSLTLKAATHLLHNINQLNMSLVTFKNLFEKVKV